jgi:hypothetical protein
MTNDKSKTHGDARKSRSTLMKRGLAVTLVLAAIGALLALPACQQLIDADLTLGPFVIPDPQTGSDGVEGPFDVPNEPAILADELFPLSEGSWWYYRNSTADHLPTQRAMREIEYRIAEETMGIDGVECFALTIDHADLPERTHYLHRGEDGIYEYGRTEGDQEAIYDEPILIYPRAYAVGDRWSFTRGTQETNVRVLFQETIIAPESDQIIFQNAWKLEFRTGQIYSYEWFVEGVGLIKMSSGGEAHEILTYEIVP